MQAVRLAMLASQALAIYLVYLVVGCLYQRAKQDGRHRQRWRRKQGANGGWGCGKERGALVEIGIYTSRLESAPSPACASSQDGRTTS